MYTVGFGDCFLIVIDGTPVRTILVDAGFHGNGKGAFSGNELAAQVLTDLETIVGRKRVDVLVATHRHQDHVYAFNSKTWDDLEVGEVWLPWVEDRDDPKAVGLWKKKQSFALALDQARPSFNLSPAQDEEVRWHLWNAGVGPDMPGFAGWSNEGALDRLHDGLPKRNRLEPRFLPVKDELPYTFTTDVLPGVTVHVLGPPRDPDQIEELDPVVDGESYRALALRGMEQGGGAAEAIPSPFPETWVVPADEKEPKPLQADDEQRMQDLARTGDGLRAAQALDDMINSTSLVLVLEIGSLRLLLPGDAEWSTWKRILDNDAARLLVRGCRFFKVGHHGSHNGTPKTLVEQVLGSNVHAMVSTQEGPGNYRNGIPLKELLDALLLKGASIARSDQMNALPHAYTAEPGGKWIDLEIVEP